MKKQTLKLRGKRVFEKLQMNNEFGRFQKLFENDEACFLFMAEGGLTFRSPTQLIELNEGEAVVAKCGNYFIEPLKVPAKEEKLEAIGAYFYPNMVKEFFQSDLKLGDFKNNFDVSKTKVEPLMKLFIQSLNHLFEHPELADENMILSKLKELILLLGKTEDSIHHFINSLFTPFEYDFKEIIQKNTFANLSMTELANLCGCSLATFKRRFNKFYDLPPAKYLLQKKLEKSMELLHVESYAISDIAYECGFDNINHFNKAFKKQYGLSPSQSRKNPTKS